MPDTLPPPLSRDSRVSADAARASLTRERWVESALALLVDSGIDSVRVDVVAKRLGVTRGSFYWHFKDRDDLLEHMLLQWRKAATEQIIERFDTRHSEPRELLKELLSLPFRGRSAERAARLELAIREWARRDPMARQALDDVDSRRITYIARCFVALGFDVDEARSRAFILYGYEVAESLLRTQGTPAQKAERSALIETLLLARVSDLASRNG
ncbi:MAG TPA: TetR/AcrR family transcriptional regulator [Burkholderiaceae bacterium]|nr:TetR/AcrR family transcriptional regulator [Burkholderiaceae bacterium]